MSKVKHISKVQGFLISEGKKDQKAFVGTPKCQRRNIVVSPRFRNKLVGLKLKGFLFDILVFLQRLFDPFSLHLLGNLGVYFYVSSLTF